MPAIAAAFKDMAESETSQNFKDFSPTTLHDEWPWLWRFFFLILFTGIGSVLNAFFVSAFFITKELRKKGNVFLACLGLADLIITGMVVPTSVVVMISKDKEKENIKICQAMHFLVQSSTYAYSLSFMLVAVEIYIRLLCGFVCYRKVIKYPFSVLAVLIFAVSLATAGAGVYYDLDYDYCSRLHHGNYLFRALTSLLIYVIPGIVTFYLLYQTSIVTKQRITRLICYKRLPIFQKNHKLTNLHLGCFLLFVAAWIPYLILVNLFPDADDAKYYTLIWFGLMRSTVTSFLYSIVNNTFRAAFYNLFVYFCCKGPLVQPHEGYNRRIYQNAPNGAPMLQNMMSPRREPPVIFVL